MSVSYPVMMFGIGGTWAERNAHELGLMRNHVDQMSHMPDKPLTVITYAASASLAAIALVYFFNPNFLIDGEASPSTANSRKKGIVGLSNPANDCFINSVLQSLAGLGDVRLYLIRELHRRMLEGPEVYDIVPETDNHGKPVDPKKLRSLQRGEVTQGLKDIIDRLNERPIYKKTISAAGFIVVLERAFGTRISKSQQDAQELLQIVAERLSEEYHAGQEARKRFAQTTLADQEHGVRQASLGDAMSQHPVSISKENGEEKEDGFPLEGRTESRIECQHCHFIPKANPVSFVMLTLTVPQKNSATLNECFDAHFKTEYIDDYKCDKCRLDHAVLVFGKDLAKQDSTAKRRAVQEKIDRVRKAIEKDPEKPPEGVELPDSKLAPTRKIARHVEITTFPKILVIHLSRSIYDLRSSSTKNAAKVSFPEQLPLGGILNRRKYKLLGMVSHKGTHNSGHYESFRRQHLYAPISTPYNNTTGPYSAMPSPRPSTMPSVSSSPIVLPRSAPHPELVDGSGLTSDANSLLSPRTLSPSPSQASISFSTNSTRPSSKSELGSMSTKRDTLQSPRQLRDIIERNARQNDASSTADGYQSHQGSITEAPPCTSGASSLRKASNALDPTRLRRKKKTTDRWWRISDEKIKECKTSDVLGQQKEVYMLFYEMDKE